MAWKAAKYYGVHVTSHELVRERYAYYTAAYSTPDGNCCNCFKVSDFEEEAVIEGVTIPTGSYIARKELELDLSMCSPKQATGIIGKF